MVSAGVPNMAMVNVNNFLNVKDSRWLQLEVCREFQRNKCTRPDTECKFAHPPPNVEVQNGRVTACYDSIKGRCNREKPPCKYFHPPQHLKDQLLINGRNHLALKNAIMTQIQGLSPGTPVVPGTIPIIQQPYYPCYHQSPHGRPQEQRPSAHYSLNNTSIPPENLPIMFPQHNSAPYLAGIPTMGNFNPYIASSPVMTMGVTDGAVASPITGVVPQQVVPAQKVPRTDRLEPGSAVAAAAAAVPLAPPPPLPAAAAAAAAAAELGKKRGRDPSDELLMAFPGMGVPYKRPAGDKSGVPVYQPTGSAAYQQALMQQLGGQSFVPVSCEYGGSVPLAGMGGQADSQDTTAANNHAAASSAQPTSSSTSTSTITTTNSPTSGKAITAANSSSSTSSSSSTGGGELVPASPVPVGPQQPVNVFSYTGYSLSKGLRPQFKPPSTPAPTILSPMPLSTIGISHPGLPTGPVPGFNFSIGAPMPNINVSPYVSSGHHLMTPVMTSSMAGMGLPGMVHGLGGLTAGMAPAMGGMTGLSGLGGSMPLVTPSVVMPQNPAPSLYPPQYTALSSNTHHSLAQGGEQPNKRLKTS
ncbi:uncharacterized protein [Panulirus ornatus]|uniref:uncharacterized protein isoform X4 n=1 Tax=Panulirus ornatus TaxID=150431 RepID=UPI003A847E33